MQLVKENDLPSKLVEALMMGNLAVLSPSEKVDYYNRVCKSVGLNPLTKPFQYITLNGKEVLYAGKECCEQLRGIHNISVQAISREILDDVFIVTARATRIDGRYDESIAGVTICNLKGDAKCNAMMKAETKAKRRVTLSICGLGMLDEIEIESIDAKHKAPPSNSLPLNTVQKEEKEKLKKYCDNITTQIDCTDSIDKLEALWKKEGDTILSLKEEKVKILSSFNFRKKYINDQKTEQESA